MMETMDAAPLDAAPDAITQDATPEPMPRDPNLLVANNGRWRGTVDEGLSSFLGIRYALPPVGALRFASPVPNEDSDVEMDATTKGSMCPQLGDGNAVVGAEDCLFLNVWAPENAENLPIMFWIHGGAYVAGSASEELYDGAALARENNVVVVSANYRIGTLGFLAIPEMKQDAADGGTGNFGIQDQITALEWIAKNASAFGGDKNNVTVFGESAGGWSQCALLASPRTKDLMHKSIIQSTPPCRFPTETENGAPSASRLAYPTRGSEVVGHLQCAGAPDVLACLRTADLEGVVRSVFAGNQIVGFPDVGPVVDGVRVQGQAMEERIATGAEYPHPPVIMGTTRDEGRWFIPNNGLVSDATYSSSFGFIYPAPVVNGVRALYPRADYATAYDGVTTSVTDTLMSCPTLQFAQSLSQYTTVYMYEFHAELNGFVPHAAELPFLFGHLTNAGATDRIQQLWTDFAKNGIPSSEWPTASPTEVPIMRIDNTTELIETYRGNRCPTLFDIGILGSFPTRPTR